MDKSGDASDEMMRIIQSSDFSPGNIETLLDFAKRNGGIEYAQNTINKLIDEATEIVKNVAINDEYKTMLNLLMMYLKNRVI